MSYRPQNLQVKASMGEITAYHYVTVDSIQDVERTDYFKSARDHLRRGDTIEVWAERNTSDMPHATFVTAGVEVTEVDVRRIADWVRVPERKEDPMPSTDTERVQAIADMIVTHGNDVLTAKARPHRLMLKNKLGWMPDPGEAEAALSVAASMLEAKETEAA